MENINLRDIADFVQLTFHYVDKEKLNRLVSKIDDNQREVTPDVVFQMTDNVAFAKKYAELVKKAQTTGAFKDDFKNGNINIAQFENLKRINAEDGIVSGGGYDFSDISFDDTTTASDIKSGGKTDAVGLIDKIVGWFGSTGNTVTSFWDRITGTTKKQADAAADKAAADRANANNKNTLIIVGIVAAVVVVVTLIIVLSKKK